MASWLATLLNDERDRWFLWVPVALGLGAAAYFGLPSEPVMTVLAGSALVLVLLAYRGRNWLPGGFIILLLAAFVSGLAVAKFRSETLRAPVLAGQHAGVTIDGWLESTRPRRDGGINLLVRVSSIDRLDDHETPYRVRLRLRDPARLAEFSPGATIRIKAWIGPPPGPATPGGYNFSRYAWFERIGAIGIVHSIEHRVGEVQNQGLVDNAWLAINSIRTEISRRIRHALPGDSGSIAIALITGDRSYIPRNHVEMLRASGLAHVLAISGLHMTLVTGALFAGLRALLAFFPGIVLRYPIKKIAAFTALFAGAFYLALSGANVATQRAFIMVAIMLVAVLLERPAISLRNVALAALFIILWRPESVVTASFQMSFAAVTALIAAYEFVLNRRRANKDMHFAGSAMAGWLRIPGRIVLLYLGGVLFTTLVASAATAPFAAYHFHRVVPFSLAGNLFAMPAIALLVMPLALLSIIAMGFGLEFWSLQLMGQGIDLVIHTATWVASWPGAEQPVAAMPTSAIILMVIGGLWLMLWRRRWRFAGIGGLAAGLLIALNPSPPDILIDGRARAIAVRADNGQLQMLIRSRSTFAAEQWLERDGDMRAVDQVSGENFACDFAACISPLPGGGTISIITHRSAMAEECRTAKIVIFTFERKGICPGPDLVMDMEDLEGEGAAAIWTRESNVEIIQADPYISQRPWSRHQRIPHTFSRRPEQPSAPPDTPSPTPPGTQT